MVDAGHGGEDSGAISRRTRLVEKTLTLDLAKRLRSELRGSFRVVMVRDSDVFVDLNERVRLANRRGNCVLVSLHFNAGSKRIAAPEAKRVQSHLAGLTEQNK